MNKVWWLVLDVPEHQDPEITAVVKTREEAVDKMISEAKESELIKEGFMTETVLRRWLAEHDSYEDCGIRVCLRRIEVPD